MISLKNPTLIFLILFIILAGCSGPTADPTPTALPATETPEFLSMPSGSGGGVIAFVTDRNGGRMDLYLINADGSELTQITHSRDDEIAPSWAPDGSKLAYLVSKNNRLNLYTLDIGAALADPVSDHAFLLAGSSVDLSPPTWAPDGNSLIYSADTGDNLDLFRINSNGSENIQLTQTSSNEIHPSISPDGSKLAFCSDRNGTYDLYIAILPANSDNQLQEPIQITSGVNDELSPTWSPDGQSIIYTTTKNGNKDLVLISWDGSDSFDLTDSPADEWSASWSSDGLQIVYSFFNFDSSLNDLHIMSLDDQNPAPITEDNFDNWWPAWKP